jgi:thiamine transport system ATP-binding protein
MPAVLHVDDLTVRFPDQDRPAVDAFTLHVGAGEVVALLGPSGCGKTTVLRCVAGLERPTTGRVLLDGEDVTDRAPHQRGVGLMFQDFALFPHRTVGENVAFGLRMLRRPAAARRTRVAEVLELVGLPGWDDRAVGSLSGGEQQRVALARALAPSPGVLLLDEPLGALDRSLRDRLVPEMGALFRRLGTTVVHVTHDQSEALGMADRVVVMEEGRIAQVGAPAEVWRRPGSPSVARFLGFSNVTDDQLVRPDAVRLHSRGSAGPTARPGVVRSVVFRGEQVEVRIDLVDEPGGSLDASVRSTPDTDHPTGPPTIGDAVDVTLDPAGIVPFT